MKRAYASGAQKRKRTQEEKEKLSKHSKLSEWFTPVSKGTPADLDTSSPPTSTAACSSSLADTNPPTVIQAPDTLATSPNELLDGVHESVTVDENENRPRPMADDFSQSDPGLWNKKDGRRVDYWVHNAPTQCQNHDCDFSKSRREFAEGDRVKTRYLTSALLKRELPNGERVKREWLLYSPFTGCLYCFPCRLLSKKESHFATSGFNDWKHANLVKEHENGEEHHKCMLEYSIRRKGIGCVDSVLLSQHHSQKEYWYKVLMRVVSVTQFLASRGLAFRGENQQIGSSKNGNFLGIKELLSEFDPFLEEHLKIYGSSGKGNPSYLSANICEEFIDIMGQQVLLAILDEIKGSKYYSISVDSTPDISHIDQLTFTVRYICGSEPVERFLEFIPIFSHSSENLADTVIEFLHKNNIPLSNCRGQSYDNASNMSGRYTGLQARIRDHNEFAIYIPCAGHSLNLVGVKAAECGQEIVSFFDFVQRLYSFFSASTHRWDVLTSSIGKGHTVVKRLSDTRWSAHFDAVAALYGGYDKIQDALDALAVDADQEWSTRIEAEGLSKKMSKLETVILTMVWNDMNKTSKVLQSKDVDILAAVDLLKSLKSYLDHMRDEFEDYELAAKANSRCPDPEFSDEHKRARKRSVQLTRDDGSAEEVLLKGSEKFKVDTYLPILDSLTSQLTKRAEAYENIGELFSFFNQLKTIDSDELNVL